MTLSIFLFGGVGTYLLSRYIKYRRHNTSKSLRKGVIVKITQKISKLIRKGKLKKLQGPIPYHGVFGSSNPEKIIVLQAGVHGLEDFAIEVLLTIVSRLNQHFLVKKRVQIQVIPIVNYWGFKNHERTNQNGVDLVRNSPYKSKHKRMIPLVSGWKSPLIRPLTWILAKTWYFMGTTVEKQTEFLIHKFNDLLLSGKELVFFDFHTGNTSPETTIWRQELDQRVGIPKHLEKVCNDHNIIFAPIDYGTHGGIYEYIAEMNGKHHLNAFTVELGVLGNRSYTKEYFLGSVFTTPKGKRKEFLEKETQKIMAIINAEIIHRDT